MQDTYECFKDNYKQNTFVTVTWTKKQNVFESFKDQKSFLVTEANTILAFVMRRTFKTTYSLCISLLTA